MQAFFPRHCWGCLVIACIALAWSSLAQGWGANQDAHYALVRALATGTPTIDRTRFEVGNVQPPTPDVSVYKGHYYSNKAPGLAFVTVPAYLVMKAAGEAQPVQDTAGQLWFLGLWTVVLPGVILLILVRKVADELEPGFGTATTLTLGLATLILPFSTLFFSHVLSATLAFGAFTALWQERRGRKRLAWVSAAGLLAGYAITTEYPNAITAAALGCYVLTRSGRLRRALAYGGGAIVGILPLLVYNQWAFGSPTHTSAETGVGQATPLSLGAPSFRQAAVLLLGQVGLLRLAPVLALGAIGAILLYRRGDRREALLIAGVAGAYVVFNSALKSPVSGGAAGGPSPGPRYVITMLPFLALALAVSYRRLPLTTIALAAASAVEMVAVTVTRPLSSSFYGDWFERFGSSDFSQTALGLAGAPRQYGIYIFLAAALLATVCAALATARLHLSWRETQTGVALLAGWVLIEKRAPKLLNGDQLGNGRGALTTFLFCSAVVLAAVVLPHIFATASSRDRRPGL